MTAKVKQADRAYIGRDEPAEDVQFARARGSVIYDARGKRYIDFLAGWCAGNLGWAHREIRARLRNFRGPDYVPPGYLYAPWTELAELLAAITPGKLEKCWRATGGTEAVEIAIQA